MTYVRCRRVVSPADVALRAGILDSYIAINGPDSNRWQDTIEMHFIDILRRRASNSISSVQRLCIESVAV